MQSWSVWEPSSLSTVSQKTRLPFDELFGTAGVEQRWEGKGPFPWLMKSLRSHYTFFSPPLTHFYQGLCECLF